MSPSTLTAATFRPELGDFSSIVCFKAVVVGVEEALGAKAAAIALISAGRTRGKQLANQLGLSTDTDLSEAAFILNNALGKAGSYERLRNFCATMLPGSGRCVRKVKHTL